MLRKVVFWFHLSIGVAAGLFIFLMAATGVVLSFERQIIDFADREIRSVTVPNDWQPRPSNQLLDAVRRADIGTPTAITASQRPGAAMQVSLGRGKTVYVDPYSGAILGVSAPQLHDFFSSVERVHRTLGAPLGRGSLGRSLTGISNLLFVLLIVLGLILWIPRKRTTQAFRASTLFRIGLRGKARDWNWHNVLGIWCALPLLVISLTGVVMSYDRANQLLFRLSGSPLPGARRDDRGPRPSPNGPQPDYDNLFTKAKALNPEWRTITINVSNNANVPLAVNVDTGTGGQPQKRAQYLLNPTTGAVFKTTTFADNSLGQRLRTFVRFGHTGEYGGLPGQMIAVIASLAACVLVYTGFALALRRLLAARKRQSMALGESLRPTA